VVDQNSDERRRAGHRRASNIEFVRRLRKRRPDIQSDLAAVEADTQVKLATQIRAARLVSDEAVDPPTYRLADMVAETIVLRERPVLFVKQDWIDPNDTTTFGQEAKDLVASLDQQKAKLQPLMPLIGRIDVTHMGNYPYVGTGWLVASDVVVTNRHVASLVARWDGRQYTFSRGIGDTTVGVTLDTLHEYDDLVRDETRRFAVTEVLYIEPEGTRRDIAFLKIKRQTSGNRQDFIRIAPADPAPETRIVVVGYPARAGRDVIPDQALMNDLYRNRYDVKRAAPGLTMPRDGDTARHDCTTLGGNSGSVVLDSASGKAVGLHFAGLYQEANYAVPASVLNEYVLRRRWNQPPAIETFPSGDVDHPVAATPGGPSPITVATLDGVTVTVPLVITVSLGAPVSAGTGTTAALPAPAGGSTDPEEAVAAFWKQRPPGVIAARVGFADDGQSIGEVPLIAASVATEQLASVAASGPKSFNSLEVRYFAATAEELLNALPALESSSTVSYDDEARTGPRFAFDQVSQDMTIIAHVGPEYSWHVLEEFLSGVQKSMVSAMYEFHGQSIANVIEAKLDAKAAVTLVTDYATFSKVEDPDFEFDRGVTIKGWAKTYPKFQNIIAPEGGQGLISDSYHMKVTVRDDNVFWLSSGNWKQSSSQPLIEQSQRDNADAIDLPGNREWHMVITNKKLSEFFRAHIQQDFKRSEELNGVAIPPRLEGREPMFLVPVEEASWSRRKPPGRVLEPTTFTGKRKVTPLLTPDNQGAVYSEAVLELIDSAQQSLLFQIPYIGMPPTPNANRGYIDDLIKALTQKLKTLDDCRVLLRSQGNKFSAPTHAAWYFKSKGVDINARVHQIGDSHTKGMIVDGKRLLIGSHNWSGGGVTLNRDASLLFDDEEIATYYAEAFQIDWARSSKITPRKYVKPEALRVEAAGALPPAGFRLVTLSELRADD
jgi:phosphatidylserine/phosphatidylglycerophosphate/cardiolipin synthase-like enzyme